LLRRNDSRTPIQQLLTKVKSLTSEPRVKEMSNSIEDFISIDRNDTNLQQHEQHQPVRDHKDGRIHPVVEDWLGRKA
jgi:hypothetical protein